MAYAPSAALPRRLAVPKTIPHPKRNWLFGLFDAIERSNMKRAEREIARYLRTNKFTDETEREIERRFIGR